MKHIEALLTIFLAVFVVACKEVDSLSLPEAGDIVAIEVYEGVLEERKQIQVITDQETISEVVGFVKSNNSGWRTTWHTYPTPQATVVFRGKEKGAEILLWFGPDWVGGQASPISPKKAYLWELNVDKLRELKSKLGVSV